MNRGYVKVWRNIQDSGLLQNGPVLQLFIYLLTSATHKPIRRVVSGVPVNLDPGQVIFGRAYVSGYLKLGERQVRTALEVLKKLEIVTSKPTNRFTIITFLNWSSYQSESREEGQQTDQQATSNRPATDHITRIKEHKNQERINTYSASASPHAVNAGEIDLPLKGKKKALTGKRKESFLRFWDAFAFKKGKAEAIDAWAAIPVLTDTLVEQIISAARREAEQRPSLLAAGRTPKWAQGWLSGRRWEDEDLETKATGRVQTEEELNALAESLFTFEIPGAEK